MDFQIKEIGVNDLPLYASIPIAFEVRSILDVELVDGGLGGMRLRELPVAAPYIKDYDEFDGGPLYWQEQFDLRNWGFLVAMHSDRAVGGATIAYNTNGVYMLEGRSDLTVLWDIRVHPNYRRQGLGAQLFRAAANWARERQCKQLKIETQNINVQACHFYLRQGCYLGCIHRFAYHEPRLQHEAMLLWYLDL